MSIVSMFIHISYKTTIKYNKVVSVLSKILLKYVVQTHTIVYNKLLQNFVVGRASKT